MDLRIHSNQGTIIQDPITGSLARVVEGSLQMEMAGISDGYGFDVENTPMGEMRVVIPTRLVGAAFEGSGTGTGTFVDPNFWGTAAVTTDGTPTCVQAYGRVTLTTAAATNNGYLLYSKRRARYVSSSSNGYRAVVACSAAVAGNNRRWGVGYAATMTNAGINDSACFMWNGTTFSLQILGSSSGQSVLIPNGTFNGDLGATWSPTAEAVYTYEIYWTNSKIYFVVGGTILHTYVAGVETWASTMSHHAILSNHNTTSTTASWIRSRVMSIRRLGALETTPISAFFAAATAATGVVLKYGPGVLRAVVVSNSANGRIELFDQTAASPTPGTNQIGRCDSSNTGVCSSVDYQGIPFNQGLIVLVTTAGHYTVIYE